MFGGFLRFLNGVEKGLHHISYLTQWITLLMPLPSVTGVEEVSSVVTVRV